MTTDDLKYLVGKTIEKAKEELPNGYFLFVSQNNSDSYYRTIEYNPNRINVIVKNGYIVKIDGIN